MSVDLLKGCFSLRINEGLLISSGNSVVKVDYLIINLFYFASSTLILERFIYEYNMDNFLTIF